MCLNVGLALLGFNIYPNKNIILNYNNYFDKEINDAGVAKIYCYHRLMEQVIFEVAQGNHEFHWPVITIFFAKNESLTSLLT